MNDRDTLQTLEGDWDRFYLEYPNVYDRFALTSVGGITALKDRFDLEDKIIADIGSGTGRSTFALAKLARFVIGLEPWASMRDVAAQKARSLGIQNVAFIDSTAESMPFRPNSVDFLVSVYGFPFWFVEAGQAGQQLAEQFVTDALRTVKPEGCILIVGSVPLWGAGELSDVIWPPTDGPDGAERVNRLMTETLGFQYEDALVEADYGSLQAAIETYGFIYGQKAIEYLIAHNKSSITWKLRIHCRWKK